MAYTIVRTDGTVLTTIPDGIVNTTSTPLSLPGRLYPGYGQVVDTNFVRALENFASTTPPLNALKGQLWFNTANDTLYVCPIDGETDPNNWLRVLSLPLDVLEVGDVAATGDITANNAYIDNDVTANHIITDFLTVNVSADIEEATINGVAYIGEANTTSITTGTRPTLGNMIGTWTVNGLGTVNGISNTSLWVTGGNLVVTGPGTVGIRTNNYMWANGTPVSFDGTYTNTNVLFYMSTFEGNLSFPGSNTAFNGNIISTGDPSNSGTIIGNWSMAAGSKINGLTSIDGAGVTGIVGNAQIAQFANTANVANTVSQNAQPNITSVGTLTSLDVDGTITAVNITSNTGIFSGDATGLYNIPIANLVGTFPTVGNAASASQADVANTVRLGAQPNITSLGTLNSLNVSGGAAFTGVVNLGSVNNLRVSGGAGGQALVSTGSGGLTWSDAGSANTAITVTGNAQPNITSVGTLSGLSVSGNIAASQVDVNAINANIINGKLTSGPQPNITQVGTLTGLNVAGSAIFNSPLVNLGSVANIRITGGQAGYVLATDGAGALSWVSAGSATTAQYVTMANQANITSVGTLTGLTVGGVTNLGPAGNVKITGGSSGQVLSTDGSGGLSWVSAGAATTAQYVTQPNQSNITSVGTLTGLTVSGTTSLQGVTNLGPVGNVRISGGSAGYVLTTNGSGGLSWASAGAATTAEYVTQPNQANITSLGILSNLRVAGSANLGAVGNVVITGGSSGQVLTTNGSGGLSWSTAPSATTAQYVTMPNQSNITSVGTLVDLVVSGGIVSGDVSTSGRFIGSGAGLTNIPGANVTGIVNSANYAARSGNANYANIAGGTDYANRAGTAGSASFATNATTANNANYAQSAGSASTAGTVTTSSQPNITSLGTLTGLAVNGPLTRNGQNVLTLADYVQSFGTNGYTKLPNGFIIQWGMVPYGSGEGSTYLSFPIAFPSTCLALNATIINSSASNENDFWYQIVSLTNSYAYLYRNSSDGDSRSVNGYFMAIGY